MGDTNPNKKVANGLLALSSAAVLAVYAAGYTRTRAAADRFTHDAEVRRPAIPSPAVHDAPPTQAVEPPSLAAAIVPSPAPEPLRKPKRPRTQLPKESKTPVPPPVVAQQTPAPEPIVEAPAPMVEPAGPPAPAAPKYKDGTYYGWGTSRHGDIQAAVVIENGRIASATIAQCLTRYSCNVIAILPPQVAQRQSPETDYVSGATQSTNAFYYAVVEALAKAKL